MLQYGTANDLTIYERHAAQWWQDDSYYFRSLRAITPFRLELVRDFVGPLRGKRVLDLGCGGGLIALPLLDEGADVTGIDISPGSIMACRERSGGRGHFLVSDMRDIDFTAEFDCVLLADVLDHLKEYSEVLERVSRALRPGGLVFAGTINRSVTSRLLAITLGEGLGLVPKGAHDWNLFIKPKELERAASKCGLKLLKIQGEWPKFRQTLRSGAVQLRKSRSLALAYSVLFQK